VKPDADAHQRHLYEGEPEEDLIAGLEPDQLVQATDRPLPQIRFSRRAAAALWLLRIFVVAVAALVIYVFAVDVARSAAPAPRGARGQAAAGSISP